MRAVLLTKHGSPAVLKITEAPVPELTDFTETHQIRPVVGAVFPFEKITAAHELMESRRSYGKIVVKVA